MGLTEGGAKALPPGVPHNEVVRRLAAGWDNKEVAGLVDLTGYLRQTHAVQDRVHHPVRVIVRYELPERRNIAPQIDYGHPAVFGFGASDPQRDQRGVCNAVAR